MTFLSKQYFLMIPIPLNGLKEIGLRTNPQMINVAWIIYKNWCDWHSRLILWRNNKWTNTIFHNILISLLWYWVWFDTNKYVLLYLICLIYGAIFSFVLEWLSIFSSHFSESYIMDKKTGLKNSTNCTHFTALVVPLILPNEALL